MHSARLRNWVVAVAVMTMSCGGQKAETGRVSSELGGTCATTPGPSSDITAGGPLNLANGNYTFTLQAGGVGLQSNSTLGSDGYDSGGWRLSGWDAELRSLPSSAHGPRYKVVAADRSFVPYSAKAAGQPATSDFFDRSFVSKLGNDYLVAGHDGSKLKFSPVAWTAYAGENCEERRTPSGGNSTPSNLALNGLATQSSVYPNSNPNRAIDGNTDGNGESLNAITQSTDGAWWQVDLGAVYDLTNVVVWNRTDGGGDRLDPYFVFVSDVPFTSNDRTVLAVDSSVGAFRRTGAPSPSTTVAVNRTGRYVRIQLDRHEFLQLAEVQVFGTDPTTPPPENLALAGTATQSSTAWGGEAARAIDGNTSGDYNADLSVTHTEQSDGAWWQVDLGSVQNLTDVVVWNRTDLGAFGIDRLAPYDVFVSDAPFSSNDRAVLAADPTVGTYRQTTPPNPSSSIPVNRTGRFIRIRLDRNEYLHLAEVQVFGTDPTTPPVENLALAGTATQSSTAWGGEAARAIDGNTSGDYNAHLSVTHTEQSDGAWWQVDLGSVQTLTDVVVWNRTDLGALGIDRLAPYDVFVSDAPFSSNDRAVLAADPTVGTYRQTTPPNPSTSIPVNRTGRFIRIRLDRNEYLHLAEVQVFGPSDEPTPMSGPPPGDGDGSCVTITQPTAWTRYLLSEVHDTYGAITRIHRAANGRVSSIETPYGQISATLTWDAATGRLSTIVDADGRTSILAYKMVGAEPRLWKVTEPGTDQPFATELDYDSEGRLDFVKNPDGIVTTITYDGQGRYAGASSGDFATVVTYPTTGSARVARRVAGQEAEAIHYELDPATCRVSDVYNAGGQRLQIERHSDGLAKKVTDHVTGKWEAWTFATDGFLEYWEDSDGNSIVHEPHPTTRNLMTRRSYPAGGTPHTYEYTYGDFGPSKNLLSLMKRQGSNEREQYVYDATTGRLTGRLVNGATVTTWDYSPGPRPGTLTSVEQTEWDGASMKVTYDARGFVAERRDHLGRQMNWTHSAGGRTSSFAQSINGGIVVQAAITRGYPDPDVITGVTSVTSDYYGNAGITTTRAFTGNLTSYGQTWTSNGRSGTSSGVIDPTGKTYQAPPVTTGSHTMPSPMSIQSDRGSGP